MMFEELCPLNASWLYQLKMSSGCLPTSTCGARCLRNSETSNTHAGSALWQIQNGKPRLIGYGSKSLPKACANYGITEVEMTGLMYNMEILVR